jgi:Fe-S cluster biogenesis protein NfuA
MIHIENTPNPNALKFLSEKKISSVGTREFQKANIKKINNHFIKNLLNLDGVELVLVSENFLSVKKNEKINWESLKPSIVSSLNDYFQKNEEPILSTIGEVEPEQKIEDNKIIDQINNILNTKIRPAVARDGGDIKFVSFDNGIVRVELRGSCSGCPSSLMTLKQGVQNLLCHYVKEVKSVEAI